MTVRRVMVFFLSLMILTSAALAADKPSEIDRLLKAYHDVGLLNGVVLVADHGHVIYKFGFGYANFEWQVPNTPDTKFRIGSVTKPFTAMLILQQVQAGKIDLDAPITKYLSEYRKDTGNRVLIRHLLTHTSGIPTYIGSDIEKWTSPIKHQQFTKQYCSGDLESQPGAEFSYNNCGYYLLGEILERVTGKTYAELLRDGITGPADMNDTGIDDGKTALPKHAYGYDKNYLHGVKLARYTDISTAFGAGDIYSTAEDLFKLDRALYTDKILPADTRKMMFTPAKGPAAMGWFVATASRDDPAAGAVIQRHEGNIFGYFTMIERVPEREAFIAVIDNTHMDTFGDIIHDVLAILYDKPYSMPKPLVADALSRTLLKDGAAAATRQYYELKKAQPDAYQWGGLNAFGSDLLDAGRTGDAIEIFKLAVDNAPQSWFSQFNLAEAYQANGDIDLSKAAYDKAAKLNTSKPFARMIEAARAKPTGSAK
jgi:CubicO group peptidase (beta-lactamase class C family)